MTLLFLMLGYLGVPVAFSLIAGRVGPYHVHADHVSVDRRAVVQRRRFGSPDGDPFFLLVGELMTSANVVIRIAELTQALVGHIRGGLAQVTTVFSMFFSGMSGLSSATSRCSAEPWRARWRKKAIPRLRRRIDRRRLHNRRAGAALDHGCRLRRARQRLIAGLFLAGVLPGLMVGVGLMLFCYFFGPAGLPPAAIEFPRSPVASGRPRSPA